jgi:hypothetical protein
MGGIQRGLETELSPYAILEHFLSVENTQEISIILCI